MLPDPRHGVFETLLVAAGRAQALERHLDRLSRSVRELYRTSFAPPVLELPHEPHRLRIDAFPDGTTTVELTPLDLATLHRPVALQPAVVPAGLGPHKWRDRRLLESLAPVALLLDADGSVLEGAWGNVWVIEGPRLVTPPADGRILPGVTRGLLLELGFEAAVEPLTLERLQAADGVFLTSALRHAVAAGLGSEPASQPPAVGEIRAALAEIP